MFDLSAYLSNGIKNIVDSALKSARKNIRELIFLSGFKRNTHKAQAVRESYKAQGINVPPFLIASITSSCNLVCKGCYARANKTCGSIDIEQLSSDRFDKLFLEAEELGISFIITAGGEPLMRKDVIDIAAKHKKIIFPIFTNGTLLDNTYIKMFNKHRNLLPVISLEGGITYTDARRGKGVYEKLLYVMEALRERNIFFGCSITVDKNNLSEVTGAEYADKLYALGAKVLFYIEYVPVDGKTAELAPDDSDRSNIENNIRQLSQNYPDMVILAFPGDEKYMDGCLAAGRGFFHISVSGAAEPCPFSPYSDINLRDHSILEALSSDLFCNLTSSGILKEQHTGGCLLHQKEEEVKKLLNLAK